MPSNPRTSIVAGAIAVSALALAFLVAAASLPIDDFWLSLASARRILDGAPVDRAVDFNWLPIKDGALNPQWAAQLILGFSSSDAVALAINALLIGGGLALLAVLVRRRATPEATAVAMLLAIAVLSPHLLARAQSFSIFLLPAALLLLDLRPRRFWLPLAYAVLMAAWANLHGAFVIGQFAAAAAFIDAVFRWRKDAEARRDTGVMGAVLVAALLAPLLNPAGIDLLAYAYAQPGLEVVRQISIEWQPAWPWVPVATLFWAYLALLVVGRILRRWAASVQDTILLVGLAILAIGSLRQIPWFVIASAPLLASDVESLLAARSMLRRSIGSVPGVFRGRSMVVLTGVALVVAAAIQPLRVSLPQGVGRVTPDAPVELTDELAARIPPGTTVLVLNEQVWGGYLVHRLGDEVEIAMDGRLEIRDRTTWERYFDLMHGAGDPVATLAQAGVEYAAVRRDREELLAKLVAGG
jgi:hypothetical protein